jgi:hypothetical protein
MHHLINLPFVWVPLKKKNPSENYVEESRCGLTEISWDLPRETEKNRLTSVCGPASI